MQALRSIRPIAPQATAGAALPVVGAAQPAPLGIYAKSASPSPAEEKIRLLRADRYRHLAVARELFVAEGRKAGLQYAHDYAKTAKCLHVRRDSAVSVHHSIEHGSAFYGGLITCGSVWACPVCSAKIQERRRVELAHMIDWAWGQHLQPMLVTLTAPHRRDQSLSDLRAMQAKALRYLRAGKGGIAMRQTLGYRGLVRGLELTYGSNGWHLHTHEMWLVDLHQDADEAREIILKRWRAACAKAGLLDLSDAAQVAAFDEHAVDVKGRCSASDYLAKMDDSRHWGADRELAKASSKKGKKSGRHPFGLLADAADGCVRSGRLFVEYAAVMKGAAQLYWSRGLKALVGVDEISDEAIAERADDEAILLGRLLPAQWEVVLRAGARAQLLDAAELGGWEAVLALLTALAKQHGHAARTSTPDSPSPTPAPCLAGPSPESVPRSGTIPDQRISCSGQLNLVPVDVSDHPEHAVVWLGNVAYYADLESGELFGLAPHDHIPVVTNQNSNLIPEHLLRRNSPLSLLQ